MSDYQAMYPVRTICRVLDVSPSGYYAWRKRAPSDRSVANAALLEKIEEIHEDFVAFTRFVWSNFVDLKLELEEPVVERILAVRGPDALKTLGVRQENLSVLAEGAGGPD